MFVAAITSGAKAVWHPPAASEALRDRFGFSAGVIWVSRGDHPDTQCSAGVGFSLGAEARSRGPWLLIAGADLLANWASACTLILITREYKGETVSVSTTPMLGGPRLSLHGGRAFVIRDLVVEPSIGAGLIRISERSHGSSDASFWSQWHGGTLRLRRLGSGISMRTEYGWRQLPISYYRNQTRVHRFSEREPLFRFTLEF